MLQTVHAALVFCAAAASMAAPNPAPLAADAKFREALVAVDRDLALGAATAEKCEDSYLNALSPDLTDEQTGTVYARIAALYWRVGQPEFTVPYCCEALSYPLPIRTEAKTYRCWVDALAIRYSEWRGRRFGVARRRIMEPLLRGLKVILDNGAPVEMLPMPVGTLRSGPVITDEMRQKQVSEMAAQERVRLLNDLCIERMTLTRRCVGLYATPPAAPDELRALCGRALADHPDAVEGIMAALDAELKRQQGAD